MKVRLTLLLLVVAAGAGCRQDMSRQPYYRPLAPSGEFDDGRSARPLVPGTVPRGPLQTGPFYTGRKPGADVAALEAAALVGAPAAGGNVPAAVLLAAGPTEESYLDELPFAPAELPAVLKRGRERFDVYCAPCHDRVGTGRGMIVERGYLRPPDYHTDLSRGFRLKKRDIPLTKVPVGYLFEVVSEGFGGMPSYGKQIPPRDRWTIVAYVRLLQYSQTARLADVTDPAERARLLKVQEK